MSFVCSLRIGFCEIEKTKARAYSRLQNHGERPQPANQCIATLLMIFPQEKSAGDVVTPSPFVRSNVSLGSNDLKWLLRSQG
jgi:hypothetical protein